MKDETVRLSVPAKAEYLVTVRLVIGALFGQVGYDIDEIEDAKAALSEACLILMPEECKKSNIELEIWADDGMHIAISSACRPSDNGDTDAREFGLFLLEALIDKVEFMREDGQNVCRLYKAPPGSNR